MVKYREYLVSILDTFSPGMSFILNEASKWRKIYQEQCSIKQEMCASQNTPVYINYQMV